jgi:hypothetical protein
MPELYPCPCCGYLAFSEPPGSYEICSICFWEDDMVQLGFPFLGGGANQASLVEAQQAFARTGACEQRVLLHVRQPTPHDQRDPDWRPVDPDRDIFLDWDSTEDSRCWRELPYPTPLYYWRDDYWLLPKNRNA